MHAVSHYEREGIALKGETERDDEALVLLLLLLAAIVVSGTDLWLMALTSRRGLQSQSFSSRLPKAVLHL